MQLRDLLKPEFLTVARVAPQTRITTAAAQMVTQRLSAMLVMDDRSLKGILTAADVIAGFLRGDTPAVDAGSAASRHALRATADQTLDQAVADMIAQEIDHLIVLEGDHVHGLIQLKDLLREQARQLRQETEHLHDYIDALQNASED